MTLCFFFFFFFLDDGEGSGGEESGSGCEPPSCETDRDIYFPTPAEPSEPRVKPVIVDNSASSSQGSVAVLCCLGLALLAQHLR